MLSPVFAFYDIMRRSTFIAAPVFPATFTFLFNRYFKHQEVPESV